MTRYLAVPGALLLTTAFVRSAVNGEWDRAGLLLAGAGALVVTTAVIANRRDVIEWMRDPRGVFAVTTAVSVGILVAALVMLNIAVWYRPWSADLTASGRNNVSAETRAMLRQLDMPVALRQFGRSPDPAVARLLRSFERESLQVRADFVDVDRERQLTLRYGVTRVGTVIVTAGDKFRKIEELNEPSLATAVLQVTTADAPVVCFVTGHGERGIADTGPAGLSALTAMLEAGSYAPRVIALFEDDVPDDCDAVVIAGPRHDFTADEQRRLDEYYQRQGRVAMLIEPDPAPAAADWLRARGIEPGRGAIVDPSGAGRRLGGGPRAPLALEYPDHPITRGFGILALFDGARPLELSARPRLGGHTWPLARTGPRSFATTETDALPEYEKGRDAAGPLTLAAAARVKSGPRQDDQSRLVVVGDADFISNAYLRLPANRDFFFRSLTWLLGEDEARIVALDDGENRRIALTERTRAWMYIVNVGILPFIPLLAGILVYVRSRR